MIFCRFFHKSVRQNIRKGVNPGIEKQLKVFDSQDIAYDPDFESDFMDTDKSYKQYERELENMKEKTRHWIVKHKYFKQKLPNFLKFSEKEQIKLLFTRQSDEWTLEKLAESFPATPEIIKKIVNSNWVPKSRKRIKAHDEKVIENWKNLQRGGFPELELPLRDHLRKFSVRTKKDLQETDETFASWKKKELPQPVSKEFLSIITDTRKLINDSLIQSKTVKKLEHSRNNDYPNNKEEDTYITEKIIDKRYMRIEEFKNEKFPDTIIKKSLDTSLNPFKSFVGTDVSSTPRGADISEVSKTNELQSNEVILTEYDRNKFQIDSIKNQIYIPRKLRKKGATYKIDDCYYDCDGEFLYRVPGMTGMAK